MAKKKSIKEKVQERIKDVVADLKDDGKLNHSNDPDKKSPGRPKGKKEEKDKPKPLSAVCLDCGSDYVLCTGGGPSGKDYHCKKCGLKFTKR